MNARSSDVSADGDANPATGNGTVLNARYEWSFGDTNNTNRSSAYDDNGERGWIGAHAYDTAGTYTVTLKVTDREGNQFSSTKIVNVAPAPATNYERYVSAGANGLGDGTTASTAWTMSQLLSNMSSLDNKKVMFRKGDTFGVSVPLGGKVIDLTGRTNVTLSSYGSGARPVIQWTGSRVQASLINIGNGSSKIRVDGLRLESTFDKTSGGLEDVYGRDPVTKAQVVPDAISVSGGGVGAAAQDLTFVDLEFVDVFNAINMNGAPSRVLVQDCSTLENNDIRGYFVWNEGASVALLGNTVLDSTEENLVRGTGDYTDWLISRNTFGNNLVESPASGQQPRDNFKASLAMQHGRWGFVTGNTFVGGNVGAGPLNAPDANNPTHRTQWIVMERNTLTPSIVPGSSTTNISGFELNAGLSDSEFRNNSVSVPATGGKAIFFKDIGAFGRNVKRSSIVWNTINLYRPTNVLAESTGIDYALDGEASTSVNEAITIAGNLIRVESTSGSGRLGGIHFGANFPLSEFAEIRDNVIFTSGVGQYHFRTPFYTGDHTAITETSLNDQLAIAGKGGGNVTRDIQLDSEGVPNVGSGSTSPDIVSPREKSADDVRGILRSRTAPSTAGWKQRLLAPTSAAAMASGATVSITWNDVAVNETAYEIERSTSSDFSTGLFTLPSVGANVTTAIDNNVPAGTYYYRVRAVSGAGRSGFTVTPSVTVSTTGGGTTATEPFETGTITTVNQLATYTNSSSGIEVTNLNTFSAGLEFINRGTTPANYALMAKSWGDSLAIKKKVAGAAVAFDVTSLRIVAGGVSIAAQQVSITAYSDEAGTIAINSVPFKNQGAIAAGQTEVVSLNVQNAKLIKIVFGSFVAGVDDLVFPVPTAPAATETFASGTIVKNTSTNQWVYTSGTTSVQIDSAAGQPTAYELTDMDPTAGTNNALVTSSFFTTFGIRRISGGAAQSFNLASINLIGQGPGIPAGSGYVRLTAYSDEAGTTAIGTTQYYTAGVATGAVATWGGLGITNAKLVRLQFYGGFTGAIDDVVFN